MKKKLNFPIFILTVAMLLFSCQKEEDGFIDQESIQEKHAEVVKALEQNYFNRFKNPKPVDQRQVRTLTRSFLPAAG